jgi:thiamine pyrophosphate-dependent acetolactate synthase large subunit-like protein
VIFVLGWPLEWVPIVLIVVPIFLPMVKAAGIDLIWFSTLVAVTLQTAWLSPPVALSALLPQGRGARLAHAGHLCRHGSVHADSGGGSDAADAVSGTGHLAAFPQLKRIIDMPRISGSEAMVEALRKENVEYVMGIVGSAFMDPLDLFPEAGIRFIQVRHEQSASLMAEGYARITGRPGVCIGQNGPGITNLVTGIASAQLNHSPVVALTPAVIASGIGTKAFQEIDQMRLLAPIVAWQLQVNRPERMSEGIRGAFRAALALRGPAQVDIPRDSYYAEWEETPLDPPSYRTAGRLGGADEEDLQRAVQAITGAKKIAILAGLGAVESDAQADIDRLAELLNSPVATVWQHNDAIFNSRPLSTGSIGYQGSQAAMRLVADADVVIALGTRLNAFGTHAAVGVGLLAQVSQADPQLDEPLGHRRAAAGARRPGG